MFSNRADSQAAAADRNLTIRLRREFARRILWGGFFYSITVVVFSLQSEFGKRPAAWGFAIALAALGVVRTVLARRVMLSAPAAAGRTGDSLLIAAAVQGAVWCAFLFYAFAMARGQVILECLLVVAVAGITSTSVSLYAPVPSAAYLQAGFHVIPACLWSVYAEPRYGWLLVTLIVAFVACAPLLIRLHAGYAREVFRHQLTLEAQGVALRKAQDELESRVEERTRELQNEISERRAIERDLVNAKIEAEESNRAKSTFLANMSHELRTPLNAIMGYSELLREEAQDAGAHSAIADLDKIKAAGRHLLILIDNVLDLSKVEAGRTEMILESVPVEDLIREAAQTAEPLARKNGNRLVVRNGCPGESLHVDRMKFRQSLLNLLSNACKFTENGQVALEVERYAQNGRVWLRWHVRDTGIGIPRESLHKLFQSFSQVDSSTTRKYGGTGLGLAISQRFCQMMGGYITVESDPGRGSTFTIYIPARTELLESAR